MKIDPLFAPVKINGLEIKNRIYMPAMQLNMARDFQVTDQLVEFYAERARGGAGMITVGYATIDDFSGSGNFIGAHRDEFVSGLTRLAAAIKENGARAGIQLNHSGRYNHSLLLDGSPPVAPSAVASKLTRETPRALEIEEIPHIIESFARAALRAKEAGFEAVEILSGTGYLISQFLSPLTNRREDKYGGSFENRMRFGLEIVQAARRRLGDDFPIFVRMNGNEFMPGGVGTQELVAFGRTLVEKGTADALCINVGWHEARVPQIVTCVPRGAFAYLPREFKRAVNVPVIASHRINDPQVAREAIDDGMCDMVAMGRALIADPFLPEKAQKGREGEITHCIACAQGCFDNLFRMKSVECLCNPKAGHEQERLLQKTGASKRVMVVGGGAAGMSAALSASEKGHEVTLYEQNGRLGGQLHLAGAPPGREEFAQLAGDLEAQLRARNVRIIFHRTVDEALIKKENPDEVILATGATPVTPPITGANLSNVVQAWDVLQDKVVTGRKVVVIGGGAVGVETALFLAEKGTLSGEALKFLLVNKAESPEYLYELATRGAKEVVLIEMTDGIGRDIGRSSRWVMLQEMARSSILAMSSAKALEITTTGVKIELDGVIEEIEADTIILAAGAAPHNPLFSILEKRSIPAHVVGDARQIAMAFDAVHQGFLAGNGI